MVDGPSDPAHCRLHCLRPSQLCFSCAPIQASDAAQQGVPVEQGVDSSPPNPSSDRSLDIRRTPSLVLRRSCRREYLVAPPLFWLPAAVLPHPTPVLLPGRSRVGRPGWASAAPAAQPRRVSLRRQLPTSVAPPHPALLSYVSELTIPDSHLRDSFQHLVNQTASGVRQTQSTSC